MGFNMPLSMVQDHFYRMFPSNATHRLSVLIHAIKILFLNKLDLFTDKVQHSDIKAVFPDYEGFLHLSDFCDTRSLTNIYSGKAKDVTEGREYFRKRFLRLAQKSSRTREREIYVQ